MSPTALLRACQAPAAGTGGAGGKSSSARGGGSGSGRAGAQGITLSADICRAVTAGLRATAAGGAQPGGARTDSSGDGSVEGSHSGSGSGCAADSAAEAGNVTPSSVRECQPATSAGCGTALQAGPPRPAMPALTPPELLGSLSCAWSVVQAPSPGGECGVSPEQLDTVVLQVGVGG